MGNCCRNDSQGYFAHEGLAVQSCKGETSVAVWITALVVAFLTFRPVPLLLLAQCLWRLACSIKVSLSIRCRTKNHWLVKCILISQGGPVSGPNSGSGWRHFESVFAILQFFYLLPLLQQPLNRYISSSPLLCNAIHHICRSLQQCVQQVALWHLPGHHLVQTLRPWCWRLSKLWQRQPRRNALTKRSWTPRPYDT